MPDARARTERAPRGFTLTELLVVIAIVGILIAFILIAAQDGVRRAQERATQSLIQKLEAGVSERIEAILLRRSDVSLGHHVLAASFNPSFGANNATGDTNYNLWLVLSNYTLPNGTSQFSNYPGFATAIQTGLFSPQRAQAIAQFDLIRAELPDVFFVQSTYATTYPIHFGGLDFPLQSGNFLVPLGAATTGTAPGQPYQASTTAIGPTQGDPNQAIGIFGATWQAAAGITKNLGYLPQGYDGADNNNNGYVDELDEGVGNNLTGAAKDPLVADPDLASNQIHLSALIQRRLAAHTHVTARSEMLYALLVEGVGPLGSVFNRDDFTNREVQDTDHDGLPEFVDAWGQPLQFFRWPIYYNNLSSTTVPSATYGVGNPAPTGYVQKGADPYNGIWDSSPASTTTVETRQLDPLDPNQTLTSIAWWSSSVNTVNPPGGAYSYNASLFMTYFHSLLDPNATTSYGTGSTWDRGGGSARRAFYSRPLILSAGPDGVPGVFLYTDAQIASLGGDTAIAQHLVQIENQAAAIDVGDRSGPLLTQLTHPPGYTQNTLDLLTAGGDDVTNHALASPTGGAR